MKYKAVIEIPKGSDRRIHMKNDRSGFEDFGPIKEKIPVNNGVMPVAYGYIENAINETEKDNVDVLVFSTSEFKTGREVETEVIGLLKRDDGDHKILAIDNTVNWQDFSEIPKQDRELILEYFGYSHKISVENKDRATEYLRECSI